MSMKYSRYFIVDAICGHVGKNNGIIKSFPIAAENAKHAAAIARNLPRVKHDYKHAIQSVREVSKEEFLRQKKINNEDPYLLAKSKYEQDLTCFSLDIFEMEKKNSRKDRYPPKNRRGRIRFDDEFYEPMRAYEGEKISHEQLH